MKAEQKRQQEEEVARERNFVTLLQTAQQSLIPNQEEFDCGICFVPVEPGEGVVLRECLHRFCRSAVFKCNACLYTFTRQSTFVTFYDVQEMTAWCMTSSSARNVAYYKNSIV